MKKKLPKPDPKLYSYEVKGGIGFEGPCIFVAAFLITVVLLSGCIKQPQYYLQECKVIERRQQPTFIRDILVIECDGELETVRISSSDMYLDNQSIIKKCYEDGGMCIVGELGCS